MKISQYDVSVQEFLELLKQTYFTGCLASMIFLR